MGFSAFGASDENFQKKRFVGLQTTVANLLLKCCEIIACKKMKTDIQTKEDIERLVNSFYGKVREDNLLAPVFAHVDWPKHLPVMYSFWSSMLLGSRTYEGNPLQKHLPLKIGAVHFQAWLRLWHDTNDELFAGPVSDEAKMRGNSIAGIFQYKMGIEIS